MDEKNKRRGADRKIPVVRMAGAMLALGGLSASLATTGAAGAATSSVISTTKNAKFGTIVVTGKTVYTLKPSKVACTAQCLKTWPEVLLPKGTTKPKAGPGVNAAKLGTVKRSGGALQVTYAGSPLYWFIGDTGPGQVHGNITDTWGKWSVVVTAKPTGGSSTTSSTSAGTGGVSF
ncbi:MAG TPA: hypothetical protein VK277_11885 [Acidimicrobiales bacterium]|nr:hypothetical protein [Acidimicrobiales bacterium]